MLKVVKEIELSEFSPWGGARHTFDILEDMELLDDLQNFMEEIDAEWTETAINDFLWFEEDYIAELFRYADWDALENAHDAIEERYENECSYDAEMGFNPYMGCYDDDC